MIDSFVDRFLYLSLSGKVGESTFGRDRYLNQILYNSKAWRSTRDNVIIRDDGCDLGMPDRKIGGLIFVHHLNPVTLEQIENGDDVLFDMNNLICTSDVTHKAIHYGDVSLLQLMPKPRGRNDTCPWLE